MTPFLPRRTMVASGPSRPRRRTKVAAAFGGKAAAPRGWIARQLLTHSVISRLPIAALRKVHLAERELCNIRVRSEWALLRLDVGRSDDLAPFLGVFGNELPEVARRHRLWNAAYVGEARPYFWIGEGRIDLFVELVDDLGRRVLRRDYAIPTRLPRSPVQTRRSSGASGSACERVPLVTARARNFSALTCSIVVGYVGLNTNLAPVRRAYRARKLVSGNALGPTGHPVIVMKSSPARWTELPITGCRHIDLAGIGLGIGDEVRNGLGRK